MIVAVAMSTIAEVARSRAQEADRRRAEADLAAALARELLGGSETAGALGAAARRVAVALGLSSASIELGVATGDERRRAFALSGADGVQIATLLVPRDLEADAEQRLSAYLVPALGRAGGDRPAPRCAPGRGGRDRRPAPLGRREDGRPARGLARPAHAGDRDRGRRACAGQRLADRRRANRAQRRGRRRRASNWPRWSTSCSTSRAFRPAGPSRAGTGSRSRTWCWRHATACRSRAGRFGSRSIPTCRRCVPTPPTWSARSPICWRTPCAIRAACPCRCTCAAAERAWSCASSIRDRASTRPSGRGSSSRSTAGRILAAGRGAGSGLGLAIAKGFIEANGGTISVDSLPGQGSTFVVSLPIEQPAVPEPESEPATPLPT